VDLTKDIMHLGDMIRTSEQTNKAYRKTILEKDEIVMALRGEIGLARLIDDNLVGANITRGLARISPETKVVLPEFLLWELRSPQFRTDLIRRVGGSALQEISLTELRKVRTLLPPILEQKKIADILSAWDKAIIVTEKLLTNSQQQKKALMQQLLTGKKRLRDENGNKFQGEWGNSQIGTLLKEIKRPVQWNDNDEYRLLSVKRRSEGVVLREKLKGYQILTKKMNYVKSGDFLISKMQVVHGATGLVTSEFDNHHISDSYIALNSKNPSILDIRFFSWICKQKKMYHKAYLCSYGVHIEKMTFNFKMYLQEKVCIPKTSEEQQKITAVLSAADAEISTLEKKLACLKDEKKALMQQLLTGKRRVKVEAEEAVSA
jgi:type I restriction enzyme S subunit